MNFDISDDDARAFAENGYLVLPGRFSPAEVAGMRREADLVLELLVNSSIAHGRTSGRLNMCWGANGEQIVRRVQPINDLSLLFTRVAEDQRLLRPLERMLGERPALMEEKIVYKQPLPRPVEGLDCETHDDRFAVHSDWAYYKDQAYPSELISTAVCLDDCTKEAGPLRVWAGSHTKDYEHERTPVGRQVLPHLLDLNGGEDVLAEAGSLVFWHSMLIHSSRHNEARRPRRLMIFSHVRETAKPVDRRNGPMRLKEAPYEWEYMRQRERGEARYTFKAPTYVL